MAAYLPFVIAGVGAMCCVLLIWGFHLATAEQEVVGGLPKTGGKSSGQSDVFILTRITELIGAPFTRTALNLLGPRGQANVRRRISSADRSGNLTVERYARRKAGDIVFYGLLGLLALNINLFLAALLFLYGATITDLQLYFQARERQEKIQRALPDFLDVLAVTVSAGLGFRHALARVSEAMPGPLAEEFQAALQQMELGASRREAFENMRTRNRSEALGQFVTALLQAEELGAPLAQALNEISVDIRREAAQWARRRAQKVNPRITMVTLATIVPGLLLLVIGAMVFGINADLGVLFGK